MLIFYLELFQPSSSGVEHGNLRELALARMKDLGTDCRDVRTREVGIQEIHHKVRPYEVSLLCVDWYLCQAWGTTFHSRSCNMCTMCTRVNR